VPRLAEGVELIGRFEGSGFKEPPFIARRADGQVVQMAPPLYALAGEIGEGGTYEQIAERLSHRIERGVTGEMAEMLIDEQLRPLGIVAPKDGSEPELKKVDPLLALKFRAKVVPQRAVAALTTVFRPLFFGPVVLLVVGAFLALDVWLFGIHGISQSLRHVIYQPALVLMLLGGVVVATAWHEIGHATACRYGGAKPGVMGVGIYIVWPAFYTDITDAYRLDKKGRLRTDLGGMYFNAIFALGVAGAYAATHFEPLLLLIVLQTFTIVQQSLPFLRLDGYYIISDLTGVPDILLRIRPILTSVLPWRKADERVRELKPWVRVVVTGYLMVLVPVIAFMFLMMVINAPRLFATGWDSFWVHWDRVHPAVAAGQTPNAVMQFLQMAVLVLPAAGIVYTTARVTRKAGVGGWQWSAGSPMRRFSLFSVTAAAIGLVAFTWWPNGDYRPIQAGERGTILGGIDSVKDITGGRPSLTAIRAQQLNGAPTERSLERSRPAPKNDRKSSQKPPARDKQDTTTTPQSTTTQTTPQDTTTTPEPTQTSPQDNTTTPQDGTSTDPGMTTTTPAPSGTGATPTSP
jgi:putative peptide zinc metalloprotease protein